MLRTRLVALLMAGAFALAAQVPVIYENGVVSAASYGIGQDPPTVTPSSIVSIFGENLAPTTAVAEGFPLPTELAGVRVWVGNQLHLPGHLLFVSPTQINYQEPVTGRGKSASGEVVPVESLIAVETPAGRSNVASRWGMMDSVDIFTLDSSGCGSAAVLNNEADGAVTIHGQHNSAAPGQILSIFGTGMGTLNVGFALIREEVPAGQPAWPGAEADLRVPPDAQFWVDADAQRQSGEILFAGRAPGFAGLDQFNVRVPENAVEGCEVGFRFYYPTPLRPNTSHAGIYHTPQSQTIPLSIRRGGGQCEPRQVESLAELVWTRQWVSNRNGVSSSDSLEVRVVRNRKLPLEFYKPPELTGIPTVANSTSAEDVPDSPRCPEFEDEPLDAGAVTVSGPFGELTILPDISLGVPRYDVPLPDGALVEGEYRVRAAGGADVGPFDTTVHVHAPIVPTSDFEPGVYFPPPFQVSWDGGQPDADVRFARAYGRFAWTTTGPADRGEQIFVSPQPSESGLFIRFFLVHEARGGAYEEFEADGLTMGGRHRWQHVFRWETYDEDGRTILPQPGGN
jgi:uncharacterized protein (TIGR03437 family)